MPRPTLGRKLSIYGKTPPPIIPAQAGIQLMEYVGRSPSFFMHWTPAFAGVVGESGYILAKAFAEMRELLGLHESKSPH